MATANTLEIIAPGALTTVQDAGRAGYASAGFRECGACDGYAFRLANLLCGNLQSPTAAVLEITLGGLTVRFCADTVFALTGAELPANLDGKAIPCNAPVFAPAGSTLKTGLAAKGLRGYLGVYGGVAVPEIMGSRSTDTSCKIGGLAGRALQKDDVLPLGEMPQPATARYKAIQQNYAALQVELAADDGWLCKASRPWRFIGGENGQKLPLFRAVPGPQEDSFTAAGLRSFTTTAYTVTPDSNRMACKLKGAAIEMVSGADILSDGIVFGSVQVSANGQPIVMLADHQTTGGYAKIATVISADVPAMAQVRPGEKVAFAFITPTEAVAAARSEARKLDYIKECLSK